MTAGLMMVYAVLVLLFGTFLQPITILFSLPLSIGGAIVALLLTAKPLTMPVIIGILMLMGIVTKNAIMLVDFAVEAIRDGMDARIGDHRCRHEARPPDRDDHDRHGRRHVAERARPRRRRRVPLADGDRRNRWSVVSTVLSLVFVPAMFVMMDDIGTLIWRFTSRFVAANKADDEPEDRKPKVVRHSPAAE